MPVPLLDLKAQFRSIEPEIRAAVDRVLASQQFILGAEVEAFEQEISRLLGGVETVGVASGTEALLLSLMALGVGEGDDVITTPYSFFASASAIRRVGARPVFVDIDPGTFLVRPEGIARALTGRTRAILPVHLFGQMADLEAIRDLAEPREIPILEDAAQALGASCVLGRGTVPAGAGGRLGCFSFFPSKNLGGAGDGGMVITRDRALADRVRRLRRHGESEPYLHTELGLNSRLDALQAAVLRAKLPYLDRWNAARASNAERYRQLFRSAGLCGPDGPVDLPEERPGARHIYHQYVVRVRRRGELLAHLRSASIGCAVYYPVPLHLQPCFRSLGHREGDFPVAETAAETTLALPVYPELTEAMQREVVGAIAGFYSFDRS